MPKDEFPVVNALGVASSELEVGRFLLLMLMLMIELSPIGR
jgi:hypothetical protein